MDEQGKRNGRGLTLKTRLALVVGLLMAALVASYSLTMLAEVGDRAAAETESAVPWMLALLPDRVELREHQGEAARASAEARELSRLVELVGELRRVRHVRIALHDAQGRVLAVAPTEDVPSVPGWLQRALMPQAVPAPPVRKDVKAGDRVIGSFEVSPATTDELAELWEDYARSALLVIGLSSLAVALILWLTFQALRPVERIRDALRALGSGQPGVRLPRFAQPEMDEIAGAFNRMAEALRQAEAERTALMRKLVESQEHSRRTLAHDLHDELSPYLVAMQPLFSVLQGQCAGRPGLADVARTVQTLGEHQGRILRTLRSILTGLHPPELETMSLREAIEMMIAQRRGEAEKELDIRFHAQGAWESFGPTLDVSVYRMVQECLTNALRHSDSRRIDITISCDESAPTPSIVIEAENDGAPRTAPAAGTGLGMLGMRERCLALGGCFEAGTRLGGGWRVRIRLPSERPALTLGALG